MQVNETLSEGLKRELKVTVPASELSDRLSQRLDELKNRVRINGFRPGKVPTAHLKRVYGKAAMAEIVENLVTETSRDVLAGRGERAAMQPRVEMTEDEAEANEILDGNADLIFTVAYEILPTFEVSDFKDIKIERPIAEIGDEEVEERVKRIAEGNRDYAPVERVAQDGDRVTMSYLGKLDGEPFEGGADENGQLVLGSGQFIPGFEEALLGLKAGDEKTIDVTFPEEYGAAHLAGKPATFDIVVKEVAEPTDAELDDEFAKRLGIESMERLRAAIRGQVESEYGFSTRQKVKRQLLDALDERHSFDLPANLVEQEFTNIWQQVMHDVEHHGRSFESEGTTEEAARDEYRKIAERRVRLGLVLSRIGEDAQVQVSEEELQRALYDQVRRYPGQEQQVFNFYKSNPDALQGLRAPIFEEKVVDHILGQVDVTDKTVSKEELLAEDEEEDFDHPHVHHHDHGSHDHEGHDHHDHDDHNH
ncbi:trigger factor [Faunimonas pinastri]|uniref:Trigger factor n=1 Tax=Faunimonas pinastri TaxID=1855383 RepID=A0A1H9PAU2_9HYPH|nr:trigger factor [Faunimonas pinastri]SER45025.1 trigger factor [Faunimonas pinastri]